MSSARTDFGSVFVALASSTILTSSLLTHTPIIIIHTLFSFLNKHTQETIRKHNTRAPFFDIRVITIRLVNKISRGSFVIKGIQQDYLYPYQRWENSYRRLDSSVFFLILLSALYYRFTPPPRSSLSPDHPSRSIAPSLV